MKPKFLPVLFLLFALLLLSYAVIAFVLWEPDPGNWSQRGREAMLFIAAIPLTPLAVLVLAALVERYL